MENVTIKLNDNEYTMPHPKARVVRDTLKFINDSKINYANVKPEDLDTIVGYICDVFGKQFEPDDVYDGLNAEEINPKFDECISAIISNLGLHLDRFPNKETPEKKEK
ncbi:phage tail assembly chaperone G [Clostridium sp. BJN0013]|uniref:phage tail assembly chaperone G n=1 Tax=Clostridium sp. BJN0013 TaxID=3236840 RepID=UPI0034C6670D